LLDDRASDRNAISSLYYTTGEGRRKRRKGKTRVREEIPKIFHKFRVLLRESEEKSLKITRL